MSINDLDQVEVELRKPELPVRDLHAIWERRQPIPDPQKQKAGTSARGVRQIPWLQEDLSLAGRFTRHALAKEEFLLVCDAAEEALRLWPNATPDERALLLDVRMAYAAALTRLGCTSKARGLLEPCVSADPVLRLGRKRKVDVLLQLGDILREESQQSATAAERRHQAEEALRFYQQALTLEPDRLEAVTLSSAACLVLGEPGSALHERARDLARRALTLAAEIEDANQPQLRTIHARAVAHAIDGEPERASAAFREMAGDGVASVAQLANTRYYARFLAEALGLDPDFFKPAFPPLQLIVFAGHLPDRPTGNGHVRFPPEAVPAVRDLLEKKLRTMDARVGLEHIPNE